MFVNCFWVLCCCLWNEKAKGEGGVISFDDCYEKQCDIELPMEVEGGGMGKRRVPLLNRGVEMKLLMVKLSTIQGAGEKGGEIHIAKISLNQ